MTDICKHKYKNDWCLLVPEVLAGGKINPDLPCEKHDNCYFKQLQKYKAIAEVAETKFLEIYHIKDKIPEIARTVHKPLTDIYDKAASDALSEIQKLKGE